MARRDRRGYNGDARLARFRRSTGRMLVDAIDVRAWSRVGVVECADGWVAEEIWRKLRRGRVWGVDRSERLIEQARRLSAVGGALEFCTWDGCSLPFPDGFFDVVVSLSALYCTPAPLEVLREMGRVLSPGGRLYVLEPDRASFGGIYGVWDLCFRILDGEHVRYYTVREVVRLLGAAGFRDISIACRRRKLWDGGKLLGSAVVVTARPGPAGEPVSARTED